MAKAHSYASEKPHAVTAAGSDTFTYDANGNMTCRAEDGETFIQSYNAENRLTVVTKLLEGTCETPVKTDMQWDFTYDGDGPHPAACGSHPLQMGTFATLQCQSGEG